MRLPRSTGVTLSLAYLGIYLLSGIYAVGVLLVSRPRPEFNPPSLAALPWTFVIVPLSRACGMTDWYQRHAASPILYGAAMTLVMLPGAALNALFFYLLGRLIDRPRGGQAPPRYRW